MQNQTRFIWILTALGVLAYGAYPILLNALASKFFPLPQSLALVVIITRLYDLVGALLLFRLLQSSQSLDQTGSEKPSISRGYYPDGRAKQTVGIYCSEQNSKGEKRNEAI